MCNIFQVFLFSFECSLLFLSLDIFFLGYDGATNNWNDYSRYVNPDKVDMSHGYGYAPYGPYSPAGQVYGAQPFQYTSPYFHPLTPDNVPYSSTAIPLKGDNTPTADQSPLIVDSTNGVKGTTGPAFGKPTPYQNSVFNANGSYKKGSQNGFQDPRYWLDAPLYTDGQAKNNFNITPVTNGNDVASKNQNFYSHSHARVCKFLFLIIFSIILMLLQTLIF